MSISIRKRSPATSRALMMVVVDFLRKQSSSSSDPWLSHHLQIAVALLQRVYGIGSERPPCRLPPAVAKLLKSKLTLQQIFACGTKTVKNRLSASSYKAQGNEHMLSGNYRLAEQAYTKAIALNEFDAVYFCNRAAARLRLGDFADAVHDCRAALLLDSRYAKAHSRLGHAYHRLGKKEDALGCYQMALKLDIANWFYYSKCMEAVVGAKTEKKNENGAIRSHLRKIGRNIRTIARNFVSERARSGRSEPGQNGVGRESRAREVEAFRVEAVD